LVRRFTQNSDWAGYPVTCASAVWRDWVIPLATTVLLFIATLVARIR
jgi:hypothetical protein